MDYGLAQDSASSLQDGWFRQKGGTNLALETKTIKFLTGVGQLVNRAVEPFGLKVAIVVWDEIGPQYIGMPGATRPSQTIDMLHTAAYVLHETHEREEGHA